MLSYVTAGESHGYALTVIVSGVPAGLALSEDGIRRELLRRKVGYGRGERQLIEPDEVLIVGDSLTSDIKGGNNAGILCGWYNPDGAPVPEDLRVDYDIRDLNAVELILDMEA